MKVVIKNIEVELSGSIVYIRNEKGSLLKTKDVNPNNSVEEFNNICAILTKASTRSIAYDY